jgi:NAD(P)-dependent dehydrogenase (short-subunit alcohol dehydrogenase family)
MAKRIFKNQTVVITGVCGGLGTEFSFEFGKAGARIAGVDVNEAGLAELDEKLRKVNIGFKGYVCDITRAGQTQITAARIIEDFGAIHVLINNAGVSHLSLFSQTDMEVIRNVMEVNFFGSVNMTKACLAELIRNKGLITVISSVAGFAPLIGRCGYSASKHALQGFFDTLRTELEPKGVEVLIASPTFIRTPIANAMMSGDGRKTIRGRAVAGHALRPETVAKAIYGGAVSGKKQLRIGSVAGLSFWLHNLFPFIYDALMVRKLRAEHPD